MHQDLMEAQQGVVNGLTAIVQRFRAHVQTAPVSAPPVDLKRLYDLEVPYTGWEISPGIVVYGCAIPDTLIWNLKETPFAVREDGSGRDAHDFDETFILFAGQMEMVIDGDNAFFKYYTKPDSWTIFAGQEHGTLTCSDDVWVMTRRSVDQSSVIGGDDQGQH